MDNANNENDKEIGERRNSNTEYIPTKCRITKPPPPKPATNPLQFIKVSPCPLFQKAHEQIKKVEEIKKERKEIREEAEDWQQNLDNWKSSRRKRQEHIIERVVEVKKFEQEEQEKHRRKSKTFSEMIEDRSKGRHKFNIPIYNEDDTNDLSDYGIGSCSSKTNSIKDVDTDDSCSILDEKEHCTFDLTSNKESSASNQSQSEDETNNKKDNLKNVIDTQANVEQYTYEGAIEDYRSRIRSKIHVDESILFTNTATSVATTTTAKQDLKNKELNEAQTVLSKGELFKRKELFDKPLKINNYESIVSRRLSEDFVNTQSIKQRLQCLEKCTDQSCKSFLKESLQNFNNGCKTQPKISNYLLEKSNSCSFETKNNLEWKSNNKKKESERCSSPETELYMDKLNMFNKDLDNLFGKKMNGNSLHDEDNNYPPSISSTELMVSSSSDREDSGIHTADVSCSVSQADEPFEDTETNTQQNYNLKEIIDVTNKFLESLRIDSSKNQSKSEIKIYKNILYTLTDETFPLQPSTLIEPPKRPPPPPPPPPPQSSSSSSLQTDDNSKTKRVNSTKRIKREIHIKRSSFLGLNEPIIDDIYTKDNCINRPPDVNSFLQKEKKMYEKMQHEQEDHNRIELSRVESHDSGLDIINDRGRLSSDTWCSSIGDSITPSPERQESEQTNSITSEEDEITKKEREIIEMMENEEKSRDITLECSNGNKQAKVNQNCSINTVDDQDSEVLKVEQELRQLEKEEFERQRDNILFQESRLNKRLQNSYNNRHSLENILFDEMYPNYSADVLNYRKSMPELQLPLEYRKSLTDVPNASYNNNNNNSSSSSSNNKNNNNNINVYKKTKPDLDLQYRKSMSDIQHVCSSNNNYKQIQVQDHKSLPELQNEVQQKQQVIKRQPIMPGKPLRPFTKEQKERYFMLNSDPVNKTRQSIRNNLQSLKSNWIQPRINPEIKNYNQHWLFQEAELRRISEQQKNAATKNWQQQSKDKPLPDSVIQSLTQRVQSRTELSERQQIKRSEGSPNKDCVQSYLGHNQTVGYALPRSYQSPVMEESQDRKLSVSGKKKCSYCNNELGRGAAMIIESLCLFYHMECFKCCVCHMQLGDGLMGTDVRVRNQKLHCHNCYSSDDGVKFSCV